MTGGLFFVFIDSSGMSLPVGHVGCAHFPGLVNSEEAFISRRSCSPLTNIYNELSPCPKSSVSHTKPGNPQTKARLDCRNHSRTQGTSRLSQPLPNTRHISTVAIIAKMEKVLSEHILPEPIASLLSHRSSAKTFLKSIHTSRWYKLMDTASCAFTSMYAVVCYEHTRTNSSGLP